MIQSTARSLQPAALRPRSGQAGSSLDGKLQAASRKLSGEIDGKGLGEAAQMFESFFVQMLLKSMRSSIPKSEMLSGGRGEEVFTAVLDEHLAEAVARRNGGIGIARMIVDQYSKDVPDPEESLGGQLDVRAGTGVDGE